MEKLSKRLKADGYVLAGSERGFLLYRRDPSLKARKLPRFGLSFPPSGIVTIGGGYSYGRVRI